MTAPFMAHFPSSLFPRVGLVSEQAGEGRDPFRLTIILVAPSRSRLHACKPRLDYLLFLWATNPLAPDLWRGERAGSSVSGAPTRARFPSAVRMGYRRTIPTR